MRTIQASEAKTRFLNLLDQVEQGESIVITRHGKPIARISPERNSDPARIQQAVATMKAIRARTKPVSVAEILAARDEGRE